MNKLISLVVVLVMLAVALVGCGMPDLQYESELRPVEEIEEIIESKLEAENPRYDIDVSISEDSD